jgi:hypothetical protein
LPVAPGCSALPEPVDPGLGPLVAGLAGFGRGGVVAGRLVLAVAPRAASAVAVPPVAAGFADHAFIVLPKTTERRSVRCSGWLWR